MSAPYDILAVDGGALLHPGMAQVQFGGPATPAGGSPVNPDNPVGTGNLTESHNIPLHLGSFLIASVIVVIALQLLGFRFVVSANVGVGS